MACEIIVNRGAVLTVWGRPQRDDMMRILAGVKRASKLHGGPVVYVTRVPINAPTPTADALRDLNALLPEMMTFCSSYHVILEGSGFKAAMKRGVMTGLLQPIWQPRVFFVHASALEVLERLGREQSAHVTELFKLAGRRGLLHCPSPLTVPPRPAESILL
jgi:hypothetical protein